ncbi:MAG TPA: AAA family ATPase [Firmicutes bacterium]|nr:AAA family ATPase [Bacillota bacterium]
MEEKTATLTADQQEAAALIEAWYHHLNTQIFVLCGYAGTGKTFLVDYVVRALGLVAGESAAFVAPTGKAASVLIQSGVPATTVHSLIYTREEDIEVDENGEVISEQFLRFVKKESIDSKIKLIVLDETSMVSDDVLRDLLSFGVKCLCCGDPAQLPPVGGSNTLLSTPVITLKEIVRQERDNPIVRLAARVRAGERPAYGEDGCVSVIPRRALDADARRALFTQADQIIVGTNRTRAMINREVRAIRGIAPDRVLPQDGEKIICTLNDWSKPLDERGDFHLVNGIIGRCYRVREQLDGLGQLDFQPDFLAERVEDLPFDTGVFVRGQYYHGYGNRACLLTNGILVHENNREMLRRFKVRREDTVCRFEFAYAVTCHKAQGSEYDFVVVIDESGYFEDGKEWLYTAVTRAKKRLVIIR